jgi:hypothetical protein
VQKAAVRSYKLSRQPERDAGSSCKKLEAGQAAKKGVQQAAGSVKGCSKQRERNVASSFRKLEAEQAA